MLKIDQCPLCGSRNRIDFAPSYYKCECGMIYRSPRFDDERLAKIYGSELYRTKHVMNQNRTSMNADEFNRGRVVVKYVPKEAQTHLDIGCSRGYLLKFSKQEGRDVLGVEPNGAYPIKWR